MHRKKINVRARLAALVLAIAALTAGVIGVSLGTANASVPAPVAGNVTFLPTAPRIVAMPGMTLADEQTTTLAVGGQTFNGVAVPANATGVTVSITSLHPSAAGSLKVWTTEAGEPGTGAVSFKTGEANTNVASVALNSAGKLNVKATAPTGFVMALISYVTPVQAPAAPVVKTIAAKGATPINVGGSIKARSTDMGSVTLPAGTWDARVLGGWTGFNSSTDPANPGYNTVPDGVTLSGTLVLVKGPEMAADFSTNVTVGGIVIPKVSSTTLTVDPTASLSSVFTLSEATEVHVKMFAYASDSTQAGSGELKANLQGAQFVKLS